MEQIGLEAILDLSKFDAGLGRYLSGLDKMDNANNKMAGKFGKAFDDMGQGVLRVAGLLSGALVAGAVAAGAAIGAFTVNGIKKAADLESQMGAIAAVIGETKDAVGPLKDLILDLGLDPTLKVNAQEAADAIEKLASNGVSMTQIMDGAAKATVLLANATQADFGTAAAIATDAMTLFNIDAANMMEAVDGITGVVNNSKFTINDYQLALAQGGGVASAVGVEFDDFNTAIAGTSSLFKSGSDAGTSFKVFLQRLIPQSTEAAGVMKELGLMTAEGSNQFYDAAGNLKDMNEISVLLEGALAGLSEEQKNNALSTLFGTDAMRAAVGLAEQGEVAYTDQALAAKELGVSYDSLTLAMEGGLTKFEALAAQLGSTDAAESAKVRMDNFKGSLEILQGVIDTVALKIGFAFLPMLKQLADRASEMVTQYAPMIVEFFESFATGIEKIVSGAGWQEVFPSWLVGTIEMIASNIDILTGALGGVAVLLASAGIAAALTAIGAAMTALLSPMALLIGGAAALGIAWNTNFLGLRDTTLAVLDAVTNAFAPLTTAIQEFGTGALAEIWAFATGNHLGFASVIAIWSGAVASVQNLFTTIVSAVTTNLPTWIANLTAWGTAMGQWITDAATVVSGQIATWAMSLIATLAANLPLFLATMLGWSATLVSWIGLAIAGSVVKLGEWATSIVTWLSGEGKTQISGSVLPLVSALIDWITTDLIPKVGPAMLQFGVALGGAILNVAAVLGVAALSIGTAIWAGIMATDWKSVGTNILTLINSGWEATKTTVLAAIGLIASSIKTKFTEIDWKTLGTNALTFIKDGWESIKTSALLAIGLIASSIKTKFTEIDWRKLGEDALALWYTSVSKWFTDNLPKFEKMLDGWGLALYGWINADKTADGTQKALDDWKTATLFGKIKLIDDELTIKMLDMGTSLYDWIGETIPDTITAITDWAIALFKGIDPNNAEINPELEAAKKRNQEAFDKMLTAIGESVAKNAVKIGQALWQGMIAGFEEWQPETKAGIWTKRLIDAFLDLFGIRSPSTVMKAMGVNLAQGLIDGLVEKSSAIILEVKKIATDLLEEFTNIDWLALGGDIIAWIQEGAEGATEAILNSMRTLLADTEKLFTDFELTWKNIGMDIVNGIGAGITDAKDSLIKRAQDLASSLPGWVKNVLGISSPSKVFMEIGRNVVEGLIVGIEQTTGELNKVITALFGNLSGDQIAAINITVSDEFAKRAEGIIGGIESQIESLGDATQLEENRLDLLREIETAYQDATAAGTMDDKTRDKINQWAKQIDEINEKTAARLQLEKRLEELSGLDASVQKLRKRQEGIDLLEDYLSLLENAGTLGIDISRYDTTPRDSIEMLKTMVELEDQIATIRNEQLQLQAATLRQTLQERTVARERAYWLQESMKQLQPQIAGSNTASFFGKRYKAQVLDPILETLKNVAEVESQRNQLIGEYAQQTGKLQSLNFFQNEAVLLEQRVNLLKQAADLGIDISGYGVDYDHSVAGLQEMVSLEEKVAQARIGQLQQQGNLFKLAQQQARGMAAAMQRLQPLMDSIDVSTPFAQRFRETILEPIYKKLQQIAGVEEDRVRYTEIYAMALGKLGSLNYFEDEAAKLNDRVNLLKQAVDLGIDISSYGVNYDNSVNGLMEMLALEEKVAQAKIGQLQQQGELLKIAQQQAIEEQKRVKGLELAMNQLKWATSIAGSITSVFGQMIKTNFLDPLVTKLEKVAGIDAERAQLIGEYQKTAAKLSELQFFQTSGARMENYIALLEEAKGLNIDISTMPLGVNTDMESLQKLADLEKEVARQKFYNLLQRSTELRKEADKIKPYQNIIDAIAHVEKVSTFMSDQLALMQKAEGLGLNLSELWSGGIIRDSGRPEDTQRILSLQLRVASATGAALENQMEAMIVEQRRAQGLELAMRQLQPLIDQTNVSSAFGQKYKAEVLDPMLRALQQSAGIDAERVRLMNEYTAAAQKLVEINKKEDQLGFLQKQLDIVTMIADQDIVGGASLFDGIAFGVNASIDDLLLLTNRVLNAMIVEVKDELGIHSPSTVFAEIGSQMMNGLSQGIQRSFVQPLNALRQSTVAHGAVSTRTLNFAMGGVTINTPMDEVRFESRVLRILERSMN